MNSIQFNSIYFCPFDHDRPHLQSAPNFEKLLKNYLLPQSRKRKINNIITNNTTNILPSALSSSSSQSQSQSQTTDSVSNLNSFLSSSSLSDNNNSSYYISCPQIHKIIEKYLIDCYNFPINIQKNYQDKYVIQKAENSIHALLNYMNNHTNNNTINDNPNNSNFIIDSNYQPPIDSWQYTLFQVWKFLQHAFLHVDNLYSNNKNNNDNVTKSNDQNQNISNNFCIQTKGYYTSSGQIAIESILKNSSNFSNLENLTQTHVFVTGSLYVVGNVLNALNVKI